MDPSERKKYSGECVVWDEDIILQEDQRSRELVMTAKLRRNRRSPPAVARSVIFTQTVQHQDRSEATGIEDHHARSTI